MIGLIRVISTLTPAQFASHADALAPLLREEIVTRAIPDQPEGVHDDATFEAAVGKVVAVGTQLRAEGARLIIVSCAADPGVAELRAALDIPVIGAGSAGAAVARAFGGTVGVLGIVPEVPEAISHATCFVPRPARRRSSAPSSWRTPARGASCSRAPA